MARLDPHSHADLDQGRVSDIELELYVDFDARTLKGKTTLTLAQAAAGPIDLDTRDLEISRVTDGDGRELKWALGDRDEIIGRRLRVEREEAAQRLTLEYQTAPGASALQWLDPAQTAGGKHPYLFSQCQPIHARSIFPTQDSARVRTSIRAAFDVPNPLRAVMSAAAAGSGPGASSERQVWRFNMPQPIPSYLFGMAVGNIADREIGPRSTLYAEPEVLEAAAWEFADVEQMIRTAEGLFGPYEWECFDLLVMPPSFPYGGMENARLTFLTPTLIAGDRSMVNVLAHELAHSWTGNLVTNATMDDFWLNEGFTVYAERRILEALEGEEYAAMHAILGRHALSRDISRLGESSPHTHLRNDLAGVDPDEVFSLVPYEKGFLFLRLLEETIGRESFDEFLRAYIDEYRFQSITTADMLGFLEGQRPGLFSRVQGERWVDGPGVPANEPRFVSPRKVAVEALAGRWSEGLKPTAEVAGKWKPEEWMLYLEALPEPLSPGDCAKLDAEHQLSATGNGEILHLWLPKAVGAGHGPAIDRAGAFLREMGRIKYLRPVYEALILRAETREMARDLFAETKTGYHPIAQSVIQSLLD